MKPYRQTLRFFPNVDACCAAIDALHKEYKRIHQRNATVELCYSLTAKPDPAAEKPYYTQDTHAVTIHAEDVIHQRTEIEWFQSAIESL